MEAEVLIARKAFDSHRTRDVAWRLTQLRAIRTLINTHEQEIVDALRKDLGVNDFWWVTCRVPCSVSSVCVAGVVPVVPAFGVIAVVYPPPHVDVTGAAPPLHEGDTPATHPHHSCCMWLCVVGPEAWRWGSPVRRSRSRSPT